MEIPLAVGPEKRRVRRRTEEERKCRRRMRKRVDAGEKAEKNAVRGEKDTAKGKKERNVHNFSEVEE